VFSGKVRHIFFGEPECWKAITTGTFALCQTVGEIDPRANLIKVIAAKLSA